MCFVLNTRAEDITLSLPQVYCPRRLHIMGLLPRSLRDSYSVPHLGYQYITHKFAATLIVKASIHVR